MTRPKGEIDRICDDLGIRVVPYRKRRRPRQTHARRHLWKILRTNGADHLRFVLRTIVSTKNNSGELWSETIQAVSDVVLKHPQWLETGPHRSAAAWSSAFDEIELARLRAHAIRVGIGSKRCIIRNLLADRLAKTLEPEDQPTLGL